VASAIIVSTSAFSAVASSNPSTSMVVPRSVPIPTVSIRTPASPASRAACSASGPPVFSPSLSSTIVADRQ
jgi:hypothetical protein